MDIKGHAIARIMQPVQHLAKICQLLLDGKSKSEQSPWDSLKAEMQAEFQRLSQECEIVLLQTENYLDLYESGRLLEEVSCRSGPKLETSDFCSSSDRKRPTD